MHTQLDEAWLAGMPKVELHVHLEGSISLAVILNLAEKHGVSLPRPVEQLFEFDGLQTFLEFLDWICGLVRVDEELEGLAYSVASKLAASNVAYAEVIVNPTHWRKNWSKERLVHALIAGFERAARDGLTDCRLLLSLLRTQSSEEAVELVNWMAAERHPRIAGLSIDGNEQVAGRTGPRFAEAFIKAKQVGLRTVAHAGESSGPEGVRDALDLLKVDRIDHGVRAAEDQELLQRLAEEHIVLNVCLTSNLNLLYPSIELHPLRKLLEGGVRVTVNTDDPELLHINLNEEWAKVAAYCGWTQEDALAVAGYAIDAAFCDESKKRELREQLESYSLKRLTQK